MKFKNEYGRDIEITAERVMVRSQPRPGPRVRVTIAGPDSVDTNEVTPREAKVMATLIQGSLLPPEDDDIEEGFDAGEWNNLPQAKP